MPSEFRPLGEFVSLVSGNTPSKANAAYWGGTTSWISAKDMGDFWIEDAEDHLTPAGVAVASRLVPAGTVLMLTRGMTLHKRVPICRVTKPSTFNQDVKAVLPKQGLSARFVPYLLFGNHDRLHERVDSAGHGTGRLNTEAITSFPVYVPSRPEQETIADFGEALDERLRSLRQTNTTLETIAQTLFKSWFIDFDPVRAKAEGREPDGMDTASAALFPDSFEDSPLGPIPRGWKASTLGDLCASHGGLIQTGPFGSQLHASDYVADGIPVVMPQDIQGRRVSLEKIARVPPVDTARLSRHQLIPRDIVFSRRGDVGRHAVISSNESGWLCGTGCLLVRPGNDCPSPTFLSEHLARAETIAWLQRHAVGATMPNLNTGILSALPVLDPASSVMRSFEAVAGIVEAKISLNHAAARSLAQLRDTLLPRLISGKLRLPEAQVLIEDATP